MDDQSMGGDGVSVESFSDDFVVVAGQDLSVADSECLPSIGVG